MGNPSAKELEQERTIDVLQAQIRKMRTEIRRKDTIFENRKAKQAQKDKALIKKAKQKEKARRKKAKVAMREADCCVKALKRFFKAYMKAIK